MKLFKVRVEFETVIRAESKQAAEHQAERVIRDSDDTPELVAASELTSVKQLPRPWTSDCRPWGERDPLDRTIGEIFKTQVEEAAAQVAH